MKLSSSLSTTQQAKRVLARAIALGVLLVLPACHIPKLRQPELGVALPTTFNGVSSSESAAQLRVDEYYNDPTLTRLVCEALVSNRELKILEEDVQIARSEILARRGAYLPFVGFRSGAGVEKPSLFTPLGAAEDQLLDPNGRNFSDPLGNFLVGLNIFWQLDIWRELRNAREAARHRYSAAIEKRNDFVTRLVAEIAENYYALMALDQRLVILDQIIEFQQKSLKVAEANLDAGRDTELPVRRFQAEVKKNQSEKLIVTQELVEVENRINSLAGRFPQPVDRVSTQFFDLSIAPLSVGVPAQLLQNRPDIRQAERELVAAGLDVKVARAHFFPRLDLTASVGYQAFNLKYLLYPEALIAGIAADLTAPLINKSAIRAEYLGANARQLEAVYNYQRVVINAVTEVINRLSKVQNYSKSIEIKKQQLKALDAAVIAANNLFQLPREKSRIDYLDVLTSQRDLLEARTVLINTRKEQLSAIVNVYQALGGGTSIMCPPMDHQVPAPQPLPPHIEMELPRLPGAQPLPPPRQGKDAP